MDSISDGVIGIYHLFDSSVRTMVLWSTPASNRNEYQEHLLRIKAAGG